MGEGRSVGHRQLVPELGRFISRDPIGFQGGLNLFNGAGASPVTMVDPSGLLPSEGYSIYLREQTPAPGSTNFSATQRGEIVGAIGVIRSLGYTDQARILESQLNSGELYNSMFNPFNVGFTDPIFKSIGVDLDYCSSGSDGQFRSDSQRQVILTAILFHEATHHHTQSRGTLLSLGSSAYLRGNKVAERDLEQPIYSAERDFLNKWLRSGPHSQSMIDAITSQRDGAQRKIGQLNRNAAQYCRRPRPDSRK